MNTELQKIEPEGMPATGLSLEGAFRAVVDGNLDAAKLAVMKDLLAMNAEQKFNESFVQLQRELPTIVATSVIPNRGKYEKFEDIMKVVEKPLQNNGFSVSFSMDIKEGRIVETCHLSHIGGFTRHNSFAVRSGGRSDSETQADCKAATTAKRNAFCNALNIVIRQDCLNAENDAGIEGDPNAFVTKDQAFELERRVSETESNRESFLRFAGATKFAEIPALKYPELDSMLRKKEQAGR